MAPEVLQFAKDSLSVGAQSTQLRGLLADKFETYLITKMWSIWSRAWQVNSNSIAHVNMG